MVSEEKPMTRIEKPILHKDPYRELTEEEAIETFQLAAKELRNLLTPIAYLQEVMKVAPIQEVKKQLSELRKGEY